MNMETSETLVKRLMHEIRAHGKAMEASHGLSERPVKADSIDREQVREVDVYDNNATFVIRRPHDRKSDHVFLTGLKAAPMTVQATPATGESLLVKPPSILSSLNNKSGNLTSTDLMIKDDNLTTKVTTNNNATKGESDVSCYSSISSSLVAELRRLRMPNKVLPEPPSDSHCPSCGGHLIENNGHHLHDSGLVNDSVTSNGFAHQHRHHHHESVMKCDLIEPSHLPPPPRYNGHLPNGRSCDCKQSIFGTNHHHHSHPTVLSGHHHHSSQHHSHGYKKNGKPVNQPSNNKRQNNSNKSKELKKSYPNGIAPGSRAYKCLGCSEKCFESFQRNSASSERGYPPVNSGIFTMYCPACCKAGIPRKNAEAGLVNGNDASTGLEKHLSYYSALPRLWDTEMWHRRRKRASVRRNEKILIVVTSIVSMVIFMTLTYLGVTTFQKITELPKIGEDARSG